MGERGSGSLERGDSSGEVFWMHTPSPFLKYYYSTFPEKLPRTETTHEAHGWLAPTSRRWKQT